MKLSKLMTLLLITITGACLLSGCQSVATENTEETTATESTESTVASVSETIPTTAVPELSDSLQQICDLGIADADVLARAEDECTQEEALEMLSRVHLKQYGKESRYLADLKEPEQLGEEKPATRYYFAQALFHSAMENFHNVTYENYIKWIDYCGENQPESMWPDSQLVARRLDGTAGEGGVWDICPDVSEIENPSNSIGLRYGVDFGASYAVNYAMLVYDRTDGKKVLEIGDDLCFHPYENMTIQQAAEAARRYYNSFEPAADMVPYADTAAYDSTIITPELLTKKTDLPDASCENLPAEWHGVLIMNGRVPWQFLDRMPDKHYYEYEIQTAKEAGYNFAGITFDFSRLQGPDLQKGMLNETRLKELDQVIAWCMKYDIHVDLRCCGAGGLSSDVGEYWYQWNIDAPNGTDYAEEFAALWKALAQRYADIPNCYLSFNLLCEPEVRTEQQYAAFFGPAVNAIREVSPDRCIIADIHCSGLTGESMAEMGVALSYHAYDPREFCALTLDNQDDADYLSTVTWPYTDSNGVTYDGQKVLDSPIFDSISANELAATAKNYGVGFMIGEWAIFGEGLTNNRYSDETISAYLKDMAETMADKGYGWCYGNFHYPYSIACFAPAVKNATYEKLEGTPLYIDQSMMGWFQEINGVK